jgi:transposase-like protein
VNEAEVTTGQVPAGLDVQLAAELIERAKAQGVSLVGPDGLLAGITKTVLQAALDAEMTEHLGYEKGERPARPDGNHRNGRSSKTVLTEVGPVPIQVPRDRAGEFEPKIVPKHARRIEGFDEAIVSLYAKGLTTGEIRAHLAEIYDVEVSRDLISRVTDRVAEELAAWQSRPLDSVYPVVLIDAIHVKIRDGQVANRPIYVAVGINCHGERDVLGLWVGTGGEGAKHWMGVLAELKNRGINDVCIACCDGLKGPTRSDQPDLASGHRPAVRGAPGAGLTALCLQRPLEPDHQTAARGLHHPDRGGSRGTLHRVR